MPAVTDLDRAWQCPASAPRSDSGGHQARDHARHGMRASRIEGSDGALCLSAIAQKFPEFADCLVVI